MDTFTRSQACTHVLVVADESTSMLGVAQGVREGINSYLDDLAMDEDRRYRVSLTTFSEQHRSLCTGVDAVDAVRLSTDNFRPDGNTALLDALGSALIEFDIACGALAVNDKVLLILATDGAENASRHFSPERVLELIEERELTGQWTFLHLAAGFEAAQQGLSLGLRNVIAIAQADLARSSMYRTMSHATRAWAAGGTPEDVTGAFTDYGLDLAGVRDRT